MQTIRISEDTHKRLKRHGKMGDTYEDVILKLLQAYEAKEEGDEEEDE